MKKLMILLLLILAVSSCDYDTKYKPQPVNSYYLEAGEYDYKGHSYIVFFDGCRFNQARVMSVVHNPDCKCKTK